MLAAVKACFRKANWAFLLHRAPRRKSIHLHAGGAYAKALEVARRAYYDDGFSAADAEAIAARALILTYGDYIPGEDDVKTLDRMLGALGHYLSVWSLEGDYLKPAPTASGKHRIEFSFAEPIDVLHPVTNEPLIYAGRTDAIMQHNNGELFVHDDKTTSSLGPQWAGQWSMRGQFIGYCWAARKAEIPVRGVTIRGLGILKTKFSSAEAGPLYCDEWKVAEWYDSTCYYLTRFIEAWRDNAFRAEFSESCVSYGRCQFYDACLTSPPFRDGYIEAMYEEKVWSPLERHDD